MQLDNIYKPTLLVDEAKCKSNISRMASKAASANAKLRPHFKTHHSAAIAEWYREYGVDTCTVSSVEMAFYFAKNGWNDLTIAFPFNPRESKKINEIASSNTLNVLIESVESLSFAIERLNHPINFFIKIDLGTHRTGIDPTNSYLISSIIEKSKNAQLNFKGFLGHAGHSYTNDHGKTRDIFNTSKGTLKELNAQFGGIISYGDTPSCSLMDDFTGFDEIRAGNFIFYDVMQKHFGSCAIEDIGVCLASPIVAKHAERNEVVVYGGGVHLSKDFIVEDGKKSFGKVVMLSGEGWEHEVIGNVVRLSQEHGIIEPAEGQFDRIKIGGLVGILPIHSCLAADLQGHYLSTKGNRIEKIQKD